MVKFTSYTKENFIRGAKRNPTKISEGGHPMIPYYYRKRYGKKVTPINERIVKTLPKRKIKFGK